MESTRDVVELDVGGQRFKVARSTIMKFPDTMLGALIDRWDTDTKPAFIDRDPRRFGYILDFYRNGEIVLPISVSKTEVEKDAKFFGLPLQNDSISMDVSQLGVLRKRLADIDCEQAADLQSRTKKHRISFFAHESATKAVQRLREELGKNPSVRNYVLKHDELPSHVKVINPGWHAAAGIFTSLVEEQGFRVTGDWAVGL